MIKGIPKKLQSTFYTIFLRDIFVFYIIRVKILWVLMGFRLFPAVFYPLTFQKIDLKQLSVGY